MMKLTADQAYQAYHNLGFDDRGVPWAEFIRLLELEAEAEGNEIYVQVVPDHCDRIVWRNKYIHLREDM